MSYKTDYGRVLGLGAAKEGAKHWWSARLTSIALVPLGIAFLVIFIPLIGQDLASIQSALRNPIKAISLILFFLVLTRHLEEGNQTIIEDYIHRPWLRTFGLIKNKLGTWAVGLIAIFSVAKISFGI